MIFIKRIQNIAISALIIMIDVFYLFTKIYVNIEKKPYSKIYALLPSIKNTL